MEELEGARLGRRWAGHRGGRRGGGARSVGRDLTRPAEGHRWPGCERCLSGRGGVHVWACRRGAPATVAACPREAAGAAVVTIRTPGAARCRRAPWGPRTVAATARPPGTAGRPQVPAHGAPRRPLA
eukprot:12159082-Alexandrium_andersonii.AAC.1